MKATYIYFLPLKTVPWNTINHTLLEHLPAVRREKTLRYLHDADKRLSLYAVLLLSYILKSHFDIDYTKQNILWNASEKPRLLSYPDIDFNFSHTHNAILCGVSSGGQIGVDIEGIKAAPFDIMTSVFHPEETNYIEHFTKYEKDRAFFEMWTRKEAYTKAKGIGLVCNLPSINTLSVSNIFFHTLFIDNYVCTVFCNQSLPIILNHITEQEIHSFFSK